jgi:hypothetical protein
MTLDDAIAALYVREINCGLETFWDGGLKVWIGDTMTTMPRQASTDRKCERRHSGSSTRRRGSIRRRFSKCRGCWPTRAETQ